MKGWIHGSALSKDKREIRYFSPSSLTTADPSTNEGCLRRYWYQYVKGLKEPPTRAQELGTELHEQNEHYLLTGEKAMGPLAMAGIHMLPKPKTIDPRILVEHDIGNGDLAVAPVRASGIPVVGRIDCVQWQGTNAGTNDVTDIQDPPNTVEVIDFKTTSDVKWIKSAQEMSKTIQMTTYGRWAVLTNQAEWVRLSHCYYVTKGKHTPRKVSLRVHRDQIDQRWEYVDRLAGSLIEVVKETNPDRIPANTRACDAFRGCPHRSYCSAASHNSLASILGSEMAASLLGMPAPSDSLITLATEKEPQMTTATSLLAKLQASTAPKVEPPKTDVKSEMKRLALEEVTTKYPGLGAALTELESLGLGTPTLSGDAARAVSALKDLDAVDTLPGSGELNDIAISDPADLFNALAEAKLIVADRGKPAVEIVSTVATAPTVKVSLPFPEDAPASPASPPASEIETPVVTVADAMAAAAGEKPKKPRKAKAATAPVIETTAPVETVVEIVETSVRSTSDETGVINLYVDCIPSCAHESLWTVVNDVTAKMAANFGGSDYRTTDPNGPLGFGRWKGVLAACLRELGIKPGNYVLDNSTTETGAVVVEAMRDIVARSGGIVVRGIR